MDDIAFNSVPLLDLSFLDETPEPESPLAPGGNESAKSADRSGEELARINSGSDGTFEIVRKYSIPCPPFQRNGPPPLA